MRTIEQKKGGDWNYYDGHYYRYNIGYFAATNWLCCIGNGEYYLNYSYF